MPRRWLLHGLLRSTIQLANRPNQVLSLLLLQSQIRLTRMLWTDMWPLCASVGSHGAQLVDLLAAYLPRFLTQSELEEAKEGVKGEWGDLGAEDGGPGGGRGETSSGDSRPRESLHSVVRDGCELERGNAPRDESLFGLCRSPGFLSSPSPQTLQDSTQVLKLSAIKSDSRFTTNAQMIKLTSHFEISKVRDS